MSLSSFNSLAVASHSRRIVATKPVSRVIAAASANSSDSLSNSSFSSSCSSGQEIDSSGAEEMEEAEEEAEEGKEDEDFSMRAR